MTVTEEAKLEAVEYENARQRLKIVKGKKPKAQRE